ncbi:MAG: cell wall synthase accessory phosphoprotein MacP [Lactovum sp.]
MAKKPLLTDDIVNQARQGRHRVEEEIRRGLKEDTELAEKYDKMEREQKKQHVYKSRRIENQKTKVRGRFLLRYLFILWAILIAMIAWIIFSPWS